MSKIFNVLCTGVIVISSVVPVNAISSSVTSSSLNSQELLQVKALQTEIQNLTADTSSTNSGSAKASALSVNQNVSTSYAQKLKDNVNKVGEAKVKQLVKKYVINPETKPSITDKAFLRLSKDEQLAVLSYLLPTSVNASYTKTNTAGSSAKVSALNVQASFISDNQYCATVSGGFNVYNAFGRVTSRLEDRYTWCYKPAKYLITYGGVVSGYPLKYSYTGAAKWLDNIRNPSCSYASTNGGMSTMTCSGVYDLFTGFQLWDNYIGVHIYYESGFHLDGAGNYSGYANRK